ARKSLEQAGIYHGLCASKTFFCRLEDEMNGAVEGTAAAEGGGCRQQDARMTIVPAPVEGVWTGRSPFRGSVLGNGQSTHVRTQFNGARARSARERANHACFPDPGGYLHSEPGEDTGDEG